MNVIKWFFVYFYYPLNRGLLFFLSEFLFAIKRYMHLAFTRSENSLTTCSVSLTIQFLGVCVVTTRNQKIVIFFSSLYVRDWDQRGAFAWHLLAKVTCAFCNAWILHRNWTTVACRVFFFLFTFLVAEKSMCLHNGHSSIYIHLRKQIQRANREWCTKSKIARSGFFLICVKNQSQYKDGVYVAAL